MAENMAAERRHEYLEHLLAAFRREAFDEFNTRRCTLNHVRLVLGQEIEQANEFFETIRLDPRPRGWWGQEDTADWDFPAIRLLWTLLCFRSSPVLSPAAKQHLAEIITNWRQPRPAVNKDNNRVSRWPFIHTENHDLMCLTIGLFDEWLAGRDDREHTHQLLQSLAWRFERGWVEWHSPCYQVHYLNPLLLLAQYAPSAALRECARRLIDLQLAERALLSVNGYLGGPFLRGYDRHFSDDRYDGYLPVMWLAFGLGEVPPDLADEGILFATSAFTPDPGVEALAMETTTRRELDYRGTRVSLDTPDPWPIRYYNTPHIGMGSMQVCGYSFQSRYFNVLFGDDPSKSLRTFLPETSEQDNHDERRERGEVAQYRNWLVARGTLVEEGGLVAEQAGPWRLYRAGKGVCAHVALAEDWHVFQVADLGYVPDEGAFLSSLSLPVKDGGQIRGRTSEGRALTVNLRDMSLSVDGQSPESWQNLLHDCSAMRSVYDSGITEIHTRQGLLTLAAPAQRETV